MAETLTINVQQAAKAAPAVYTVPGSAIIEALSAFARYDGTAAATSFLPALTFYSEAGLILARVFPGSAVAAGGTADVTFAPFLGEDAGIQFNIPTAYGPHNEGDYLDILTTGYNATLDAAISIDADIGPLHLYARNGTILITSSQASEAGGIFLLGATVDIDGRVNGIAYHGAESILFSSTADESTWYDDLVAPIFRIDNDGTIHGRAAVGAITWDL